MPTRADIVAEALRWEGTRFIHQHYHRGHGCDCLGLPRGVGMAVIGFDATAKNPAVRPLANYGMQPEPEKLWAALRLFCDEIPIASAEPGDLLLLRFDPKAEPSHVAILLPNRGRGRYVIHALQSRKKVVVHRMDKRWQEKIVAAFAFRGLE